jgi:hypothetical protein
MALYEAGHGNHASDIQQLCGLSDVALYLVPASHRDNGVFTNCYCLCLGQFIVNGDYFAVN